MTKTSREVVTLVLLLIACGISLTAIATPGWCKLSMDSDSKTSTIQIGLFYIKVCVNEDCVTKDYEELSAYGKTQNNLPGVVELQAEGIVTVALLGISCVLLIFSDTCSCNKRSIASVVAILSVFAVTAEFILVVRMAIGNSNLSFEVDLARGTLENIDMDMEVNFPYSILIAGVGIFFGISGFVSSIALRSSLLQNSGGQVIGLVTNVHPSNRFTILQETHPEPSNVNLGHLQPTQFNKPATVMQETY